MNDRQLEYTFGLSGIVMAAVAGWLIASVSPTVVTALTIWFTLCAAMYLVSQAERIGRERNS